MNTKNYVLLLLLTLSVFSFNACSQQASTKNEIKDTVMKKELTAEEKRVIINKGTEAPFIGEYTDHFEEGVYTCKQCGSELYTSTSKFHSGCGWPSFDQEIPGHVKKLLDADGRRTEIVCAKCDGHLGHVFYGEGFTKKDTRHCVNSISMEFIKKEDIQKQEKVKTEIAIFAGGCFWGVEYYFQNAPGVLKTQVGYIGGHKDNPTYKEVCAHTTGHIEAMEVTFDPTKTSYETLAKLFFEIHDPTQTNGQGGDIGEQYLSVIFYTSDQQKEISQKLIGILESKGYKIATTLRTATKFWPAEDYHQQYYTKTGGTPYCHSRRPRF
jgi:peptide methionine sulfoxide reductase msrA/msrB